MSELDNEMNQVTLGKTDEVEPALVEKVLECIEQVLELEDSADVCDVIRRGCVKAGMDILSFQPMVEEMILKSGDSDNRKGRFWINGDFLFYHFDADDQPRATRALYGLRRLYLSNSDSLAIRTLKINIREQNEDYDEMLNVGTYECRLSFNNFFTIISAEINQSYFKIVITDADGKMVDGVRLLLEKLKRCADIARDNTHRPIHVRKEFVKVMEEFDSIPIWGLPYKILFLQGLVIALEEDGKDELLLGYMRSFLTCYVRVFMEVPYTRQQWNILRPFCRFIAHMDVGRREMKAHLDFIGKKWTDAENYEEEAARNRDNGIFVYENSANDPDDEICDDYDDSDDERPKIAKTGTDDTPPLPALPQGCTEAVGKVLTDTFTVQPGGTVLNSRQQLSKAAAVVDLSKNVEVAMLMAVGVELGAVRSGATCPDFIRALAGLGLMGCLDDKALKNMADGMSKKLNGSMRHGVKQASLPANHRQWKTQDRKIGDRIYDAMRTPGQ